MTPGRLVRLREVYFSNMEGDSQKVPRLQL